MWYVSRVKGSIPGENYTVTAHFVALTRTLAGKEIIPIHYSCLNIHQKIRIGRTTHVESCTRLLILRILLQQTSTMRKIKLCVHSTTLSGPYTERKATFHLG